MISSTAVSISSGCARSRSSSSGCSSSVLSPMAMALRVVSEPAMARIRNQRSSSISLSSVHGAVVEGELGVHELRPHVVLGRVAPRRAEGVGVDQHAHLGVVLLGRGDTGLGVPRPQHRLHVVEDRRALVDGDAHDVGDDVQRQQLGDLADELAAVAPLERVDDAAGPALHHLVEPGDHPGREAEAHQATEPALHRRVGVHDRLAAALGHHVAQRAAVVGGEALRVAADLPHDVVAGHDVEAGRAAAPRRRA